MLYPWPLLLALVASFFFFFSFQSLFSTFPLFLKGLGGGAVFIGAAQGSFALTAILFRPLAGWLSDRAGRKAGLILGSVIFTLSMLLYCFVEDLESLLLLRAFHGTGIAFFTTSFIAFISDLAPSEKRGEIMGIGGISAPVSLLLAPLLGDWLASGGNFQRLFLASFCFGALSLALTLFLPETFRSSEQIRESGTLSNIGNLILLTGALGVSYGAVISFLPIFTAEKGLGPAGLFFSLFSLMLLPSLIFGGKLSDKAGRHKVAIPAATLITLAMALLPLIRSRLYLALSALIYGLGYGALRPTIEASIADRVPPIARGRALGFNYAGFDLGIGLGSVALGFLAQKWGYSSVYTASAAVIILATAIFTWEVLKC